MISRFEWLMAFRYLKAKRKEKFVSVISLFSLIGICIGVMTLIIVMSVMNGFRNELLSHILGINGHANVFTTYRKPISDYEQLAERINNEIRQYDEQSYAIPLIQSEMLYSANGKSTGGLVRAMKPSDLLKLKPVVENLEGISVSDLQNGEIIIGYDLANKLRVTIGDYMTLTSPKGKATAFGVMPRISSYKVAGIFDVGMHEYDSTFVFMTIETAQKFLDYHSSVTHIEIFVSNPEEIKQYRPIIKKAINDKYFISDWQDLHRQYFNQLQVERNVMFLILTLIILVAAFNIISSLIMLVKDKGKDIAILKTIGASKKSIMRIFIISGSFIGLVGTTLGAFLGLLICYNIQSIQGFLERLLNAEFFPKEVYFIAHLPSEVDYGEVTTVILMALLLSFLATIYPSYKASKLDPVEALRYE
jgi:lipoprotein-releasing system permease protein